MDVLGGGGDLVLAEAAEGFRHELEVLVEVAGCVEAGQRGHVGGVAVGGYEVASAVEGAGRETPLGLAGEQPSVEFSEGVGDEAAGEPSFGIAQRTPADERVADAQRRGGVRQVVQEALVVIAQADRMAARTAQRGVAHGQRIGRRLHIRLGHSKASIGSHFVPVVVTAAQAKARSCARPGQ